MPKPRPPHLHHQETRHGRFVWYVRKDHGLRVLIRAEYDTEAFWAEYRAARTPNPCVMCNNWLKFGKLWEFAQQVEADAIATGHYAQVRPAPDEDRPALVQGADRSKDQSYVLFGIARNLLDRVIFPVGGYEKPAIRELAPDATLEQVQSLTEPKLWIPVAGPEPMPV